MKQRFLCFFCVFWSDKICSRSPMRVFWHIHAQRSEQMACARPRSRESRCALEGGCMLQALIFPRFPPVLPWPLLNHARGAAEGQ